MRDTDLADLLRRSNSSASGAAWGLRNGRGQGNEELLFNSLGAKDCPGGAAGFASAGSAGTGTNSEL